MMNRRILAVCAGVLLLLTGVVTLALRSADTREAEAEAGKHQQVVLAANTIEKSDTGEQTVNTVPEKQTAKAVSTIGKVVQKPATAQKLKDTTKHKNTQKAAQQKSPARIKNIASRSSVGFDANKVIRYAMTLKGTHYRSGGSTPKGFDCSGFTSYVFKNSAGINLPHSSSAQAGVGKALDRNALVPGALVYFNTSGSGVSHVGIYIGNSKFIDSSNSKGVAINSLNDKYWGSRYRGARLVK